MNTEDTIVAVSTPPVMSAIAVVRLAGPRAREIAEAMLSRTLDEPRLMYCAALDAGGVKDKVMAVRFEAPHSYTGGDMAEIHCHGSPVITRAIVARAVELGCRTAERGEFTMRAYLAGKMDLTRAEGVIDLIESETRAQASAAYAQSEGGLHARIAAAQQTLVDMIAAAEVAVDYPEEDVEAETEASLGVKIAAVREELASLASTYDKGRLIRDGIRLAIVGRPNVGKSRLLNALLGEDRAIVTDLPGTTRDTLEEGYVYRDLKFIVVDTAGIRETSNRIEAMGVERSYRALGSCDIALAVTVANQPCGVDTGGKKTVTVVNKCDLVRPQALPADGVSVSALTGEGIEALKEKIFECAGASAVAGQINNLRHFEAVTRAGEALSRAAEALGAVPLDLVTIDLSCAYRALGEITGLTASDEIVGRIFSRFCVGK